jgi:hypothetical protein
MIRIAEEKYPTGEEFVDRLGEELISKYPQEMTLVHAFTVRMI